jgi:ABC-type phosphate/phosphonate transport system permease subunit
MEGKTVLTGRVHQGGNGPHWTVVQSEEKEMMMMMMVVVVVVVMLMVMISDIVRNKERF